MGAVRIAESDHDQLEHVIGSNGNNADALISILQDIQAEYHYLPEETLRHVAKRLNLPLIQVYGVATFFKAFSLKPKGKHQCAVCTGTACHVRGAGGVLEEFERKLDIKSGETISQDSFKGLIKYQSLSHASPDKSFLIYSGTRIRKTKTRSCSELD